MLKNEMDQITIDCDFSITVNAESCDQEGLRKAVLRITNCLELNGVILTSKFIPIHYSPFEGSTRQAEILNNIRREEELNHAVFTES